VTDHIEKAGELLAADLHNRNTVEPFEVAVVDALRGIGHALLAIHDRFVEGVEFKVDHFSGTFSQAEPPADISGIETEQR
jgi:hypothetical protein